MDLVSFYL